MHVPFDCFTVYRADHLCKMGNSCTLCADCNVAGVNSIVVIP